MTVINKAHMINVVRRAYGPDFAESVRDKLPDQVDLANPADMDKLYELGLTPEGLVGALGGEY